MEHSNFLWPKIVRLEYITFALRKKLKKFICRSGFSYERLFSKALRTLYKEASKFLFSAYFVDKQKYFYLDIVPQNQCDNARSGKPTKSPWFPNLQICTRFLRIHCRKYQCTRLLASLKLKLNMKRLKKSLIWRNHWKVIYWQSWERISRWMRWDRSWRFYWIHHT